MADQGIGLGYSNASSKTDSTTNTSGNSTETTVAGDSKTQSTLSDYIDQLFGKTQAGAGDYSKANAISDAQGQVASIFNNFKNSFLPTVYQAQNGTGGYNSTSGQLMANNGYAQATAQAAGAVLSNINSYGQLSINQGQNTASDLLVALGLGQKGTTTTTSNFATNTFGTSGTSAKGFSASDNSGSGNLINMLGGLFG